MRRWIVDANNVMGARPDGWWRDRSGALARLVDEITRWRETTGEPVIVVADGRPTPFVPEGELYGVMMLYAATNRAATADDEIVRLVPDEQGQSEGPVIVVTSDRELRTRVSGLGARAEGARRFLDRISDIDPRRRDRAVLARFGIDESALLGRGGEARVFALDDERVLRLMNPGTDPHWLHERRVLLDTIGTSRERVALPEILEHVDVEGRQVVIERRLPGRDAIAVLGEPGTDRAALVRDYLDVAAWIVELPCPTDSFGELGGNFAIAKPSFEEWSTARLAASLRAAGSAFAGIDPVEVTESLMRLFAYPAPSQPVLVHLDAFLGNMLADGDRITALLDFGPMTVAGLRHLDPLVAIAYLAPEITPTATAGDRAVAEAWAVGAGLAEAVGAAERWIATYWTGALDDVRLRRWCARILLGEGQRTS